jgi:drug/metabolite transporter (DMT)-like permease
MVTYMRYPRLDSRLASIVLALFVVFLWATSWVLIKIGLEDIPALTFAGLRYFLAFLFLLPVFFLFQKGSKFVHVSPRKMVKLIALGILLYTVTQGAQFMALDYMPAVTVNLLWSFSPIAVLLLGVRFLDERPTVIQFTGVLLAAVGAIIYFYPARFPSNYQLGLLVSAVGVLSNAGASVLGRDLNRSKDLEPLVVTIISMGIGSITLLVAAVWLQGIPQISLQGWLIVAWLAIVNTAFAFTLWNFTMRSLSATESSVINGTMMIWIPVLAVVFLDEQLMAKEIAGLVVAGIGTVIVQMKHASVFSRFLAPGKS